MKKDNNSLRYSPTDLTRFYKSPFASWMARLALESPKQLAALGAQKDTPDPLMQRLQSKGYEHEEALEKELTEQDRTIVTINGNSDQEKYTHTKAAMIEGADVIVQAY